MESSIDNDRKLQTPDHSQSCVKSEKYLWSFQFIFVLGVLYECYNC